MVTGLSLSSRHSRVICNGEGLYVRARVRLWLVLLSFSSVLPALPLVHAHQLPFITAPLQLTCRENSRMDAHAREGYNAYARFHTCRHAHAPILVHTHIELYAHTRTQTLPANSTTTVSFQFRKAFFKLNEHTPDANRGLDIGYVCAQRLCTSQNGVGLCRNFRVWYYFIVVDSLVVAMFSATVPDADARRIAALLPRLLKA